MTLSVTPLIWGLYVGTLYDCQKVHPMGVYSFPPKKTCNHVFSNSTVSHFKAKVLQYSPKRTQIEVTHCQLNQVILTCKTSFFGSHTRQIHSIPKVVSPEVCMQAWAQKSTKYGPLAGKPNGKWVGNSHDSFLCSWLRTKTAKYMHFHLSRYVSSVMGDSPLLQQSITSTRCSVYRRWCTPSELPNSVIVWDLPKEMDRRLYHERGVHEVSRIGDFVLIPSLKIGGAVQQEDERGSISLDNGIVLEVLGDTKSTFSKLLNSAKNLSRVAPADAHAALLEAHIALAMEQERLNLISVWQTICILESKVSNIEKWALSNFPESTSNWLEGYGTHIELAGEGISISSCTPITSYRIVTNRTINSICYYDFPVYVEETLFFLHIPTRTLRKNSRKIKCSERPTKTYIFVKAVLFHINRAGKYKTISARSFGTFRHYNRLNKIRGYNPKVTKKVKSRLDHYSILNLVTESQQTMEEINQIANLDVNSDFANNFGKLLGKTISSISDGASHIIRAVGGAIHDGLDGAGDLDKAIVQSISNATGTIISSTGHAVKDAAEGAGSLFESAWGGIGGTIRMVLICVLALFFIYFYFSTRGCHHLCKLGSTAQRPEYEISMEDLSVCLDIPEDSGDHHNVNF